MLYESGDGTSQQKSIAGSFELPMYKVLMEMSLRGVLIVDFEISFTTGLITPRAFEVFKESKFDPSTKDVNASEGSEK